MSGERKFIHDLASPLATLFILVDGVLDDLRSKQAPEDPLLLQVQQMMNALEQMKGLVAERRIRIRDSQR